MKHLQNPTSTSEQAVKSVVSQKQVSGDNHASINQNATENAAFDKNTEGSHHDFSRISVFNDNAFIEEESRTNTQETQQKSVDKGEPKDVLKSLREYDAKDKEHKDKEIEKTKFKNSEKEKEGKLPKNVQKSIKHDIKKRNVIKKNIEKEIKEKKKLEKKSEKNLKRGKWFDKFNMRFIAKWFNKKADKRTEKANHKDIDILNLKIKFNEINNQIIEEKGYTKEAVADLKKQDLTVPNIEDNYEFGKEEIDALKLKGLAIPENVGKYMVNDKAEKEEKFDPKQAAIQFISDYMKEGETNPEKEQEALSTEDKLLILKYYKVEDAKEYDLYILDKFIQKYLLPYPKEIEKIFGFDNNQIKPDDYIDMLKPGVNSVKTSKPKDTRMVDHYSQVYKEGRIKNRRANKILEQIEDIKFDKEVLDGYLPKKQSKKLEKKIKKSEKLEKQGYTGYDTGIGTQKGDAETLKSADAFVDVLKEINKNHEQEIGQANSTTEFGTMGKQTISVENLPAINEGQLEMKEKYDRLKPQKAIGGELSDEEKEFLESIEKDPTKLVEAQKNDLVKQAPDLAMKALHIPPIATSLLQNKILPFVANNEKALTEIAVAGGGVTAISLGIYNFNKIKEGDAGELAALPNILSKVHPNFSKKLSFGQNYNFGQKEYEKTTFEGKLNLKNGNTSLNEGLTKKITTDGLSGYDWRKGYNTPISGKLDFTVHDAVKKSGNTYLEQNFNAYIDSRLYLASKAGMGSFQKFNQKIQGDKKNEDAADRNKGTYDNEIGISSTSKLENHTFTASAGYQSLNLFDTDEKVMNVLNWTLQYEDKLFNSLSIDAKVSGVNQDTKNNYDLKTQSQSYHLGLKYDFANPKKYSGAIALSGEHTHETPLGKDPMDSYKIQSSLTFMKNSKNLMNKVSQFEWGVKFESDLKGGNQFKAFLILRPR